VFKKALLKDPNPWPKTKNGIPFREYLPKKYALAFSLPQDLHNMEDQYNALLSAVKEIFYGDK